jgi:hypothetical protein
MTTWKKSNGCGVVLTNDKRLRGSHQSHVEKLGTLVRSINIRGGLFVDLHNSLAHFGEAYFDGAVGSDAIHCA